MATTKSTPADSKSTPPPADEVDYRARTRKLEAELAELRAARPEAAEGRKPAKETHAMVLANGDTVRTASPVATHHHVEDVGLVPVLSVFELSGEEE